MTRSRMTKTLAFMMWLLSSVILGSPGIVEAGHSVNLGKAVCTDPGQAQWSVRLDQLPWTYLPTSQDFEISGTVTSKCSNYTWSAVHAIIYCDDQVIDLGVQSDTANVFSFAAQAPSQASVCQMVLSTSVQGGAQLADERLTLVFLDDLQAQPTVTLTAPLSSSVVWPAPVQFAATANGAPGFAIVGVEFVDQSTIYPSGSRSLGEDTTAPYSMPQQALAPGVHSIRAIATDVRGYRAISNEALISSAPNQSPVVRLTNPIANSAIAAGSTTEIRVQATDFDGYVSKVDFYSDSKTKLGTITRGGPSSEPYVFSWTPSIAKGYQIYAIAEDNLGLTKSVGPLPVTVTNNAPVLALTQPVDGVFVAHPTPIALSVTAVDDQAIAAVSYVISAAQSTRGCEGTTVIASAAQGFAGSWTPPCGGRYSIQARATDALGVTGTSATNEVFVTKVGTDVGPYVRVTSPASGLYLKPGMTLNLTAQVRDDGSTASAPGIAKVHFYIDGAAIKLLTAYQSYNPTTRISVWTTTYVLPANTTVGMHQVTASAHETTLTPRPHSPQVPINVVTNLPTAASLSLPGGVTSLTMPATTTLTATMSDPDGSIVRNEFYRNDVLIASYAPAQSQIAWTPDESGDQVWKLRVLDSTGTWTEAQLAVSVARDPLRPNPMVSIVSHVSGEMINRSVGNVLVRMLASDSPSGIVRYVELFDGAQKIGHADARPDGIYHIEWAAPIEGAHRLTAKAVGQLGAVTISPAINVFVTSASPSIAIVTPASGTAGFVTPEDIWVSVNASDDVGVTEIRYYLDSNPASVASVVPPSLGAPVPLDYVYEDLLQGPHTLRARAYDAGGNFTDSASVSVTIAANVLPTAILTAPTSSGPYLEGARIAFDAVVSDPDEHMIDRVEFINAGNQIIAVGQLRLGGPTPTYSGSWSVPPGSGSYSVRARAVDKREGVGISAPRTIDVIAATPPLVSLATPILPGTGNLVFVNESVQLTAQVNDPDINLGGHLTLVEFRRHYTAANGQPTSELIHSNTSGTSGTYAYSWTVPASAVGQTSTFSVTAKDDGPNGRNTTTVSSSTPIVIGQTNRAPTDVRFMPRQIGAAPLVPAMPSAYGPGLQHTIDILLPYRVQAGSVVHLCAFAQDADDNLAGIRFYLSKPASSQERLLALADVRSSNAVNPWCVIQKRVSGTVVTEFGFAAAVELGGMDVDVDVQFIRAEAFDTRAQTITTVVNPARTQPGHIACVGERFEQASSLWGSPCVKFSIPVAVMSPVATTSPCGSGTSTNGLQCDGLRFALPGQPVETKTVLQAERYDAGGQGLAMFEKDFVPNLSPRGDRTLVTCEQPPLQYICRLAGFDNGEFRRYSVTMPQPGGSIEYTVKFKTKPYVQLTAPSRDLYVGHTSGIGTVYNWVDLHAKATAHIIGSEQDSLARVVFLLERLDGDVVIETQEVDTGLNANSERPASWRPGGTGEQVWRVTAKVTTVFDPNSANPYTIEGQSSEPRIIRFVHTLPQGYVAPELPTIAEESTAREPRKDLGEFEGRAALACTPLPSPTLEISSTGTTTGWFLQKSCLIGLPPNDYYFNLHSDADGTEVDSIEFEYASTAISGIGIEVATPQTGDEFPVGAYISFQSEFNGAAQGATVQYVIRRGTTVVDQITSSAYPAFLVGWPAPSEGNYSVEAVGQLTSTTAPVTSVPVTFMVRNIQNPPPQVTLTSPSADIAWQTGAPLSLAMTATDANGVESAQFLLVRTGGGSPPPISAVPSGQSFTASWTPATAGVYTLTGTATDTLGATSTSAARTITVTTPTTPTVSFFASPSTNLIAPASTELRATVTGGSNISVQFEHDTSNTVICSGVPQSGNLYTCTWGDLAAGSYGLHARAFVDGQPYVSASITLVVTHPEPVSATRTYVYDEYERLCKVINPESGATFFGYDLAGNLEWTLEGSNLTGDICDRAAVENSPLRVMRNYDEMNRLKRIDYPAGTDDVRYDYELDGALKTVEVLGASDALRNKWTYTYNKRRMNTSETLLLDGESRAVDYAYNVNGHLESLTYPGPAGSRRTVEYMPNGLGQARKVADAAGTPGANTYANAISYYPNGAIHAFTYGNGIRHEMTPNDRQLPERSLSTRLGVTVIDDRYHYDDNGNVAEILDYVTPTFTRSMDYDALDRLTHTSVGAAFWNSSDFTYDALDNIRTAKQGTRQFRYLYDNGNKRLTQMYDPTGSNHIDLAYNAVGDVISKLSVIATVTKDHDYTYDAAHRLLAVPNVASYEYDGHGRRVKEIVPTQLDEVGFYNQAGQKLYTKKGSTETHNIYFGGSLLAELKSGTPYELTYLHTDALGSVVAKSSGSGSDIGTITERYRYTPYGEDFGGTLNGLGYTGHDMDQETGLTYMQQRYYDPVVGRFLAVDPVATDPSTGGNFNRYWYANNNPYRFVDPDGRNPEMRASPPSLRERAGILRYLGSSDLILTFAGDSWAGFAADGKGYAESNQNFWTGEEIGGIDAQDKKFSFFTTVMPAGAGLSVEKTASSAANHALVKLGRTRGGASEMWGNGRKFVAISQEKVPFRIEMTRLLASFRGDLKFCGQCAEIKVIEKALNAGVNPRGMTIRTINIGQSGKGHLTPKPPCESCIKVLEYFGVKLAQ